MLSFDCKVDSSTFGITIKIYKEFKINFLKLIIAAHEVKLMFQYRTLQIREGWLATGLLCNSG